MIVIGRQCGSGGREIGKKLAQKLGISYYDRRLLTDVSEEHGLRTDLLEKHDERRRSGLASWLASSCGAHHASYSPSLLAEGALKNLQEERVRTLVEGGSCVIVGRGADYIGRDLPHVVSVFLHAPLEVRVNRIMQSEAPDLSQSEVIEMVNRTDRRREVYYNDFTGRKWGAADNYHLSFDTSIVAPDTIVEMIETYIHSMCGNRS